MKASSIWTGDRIRYRGNRYRIWGIIKLYHPDRIRILLYGVPGVGKWKSIPGDYTVMLEHRRGETDVSG